MNLVQETTTLSYTDRDIAEQSFFIMVNSDIELREELYRKQNDTDYVKILNDSIASVIEYTNEGKLKYIISTVYEMNKK